MRIDNSGNVGIGTANPATTFQVARDVSDTDVTNGLGQLILGGLTVGGKRLIAGYNTTSNYAFLQGNTFGSTWDNVILEPKGGNVGIGTTSPSVKLEVAGNIIASNPISGNHVATKDYVDTKVTTAAGGAPNCIGQTVNTNSFTNICPTGYTMIW